MSNLASFAAQSLWNVLGVPQTRILIDNTTFVLYVLPSVICYFVLAVLAVTPQTHTIRVALWPLSALLALRATLCVDMTHGQPERASLQTAFALLMFSGVTRSLGWTLPKAPLVRHLRPKNSSPSTIMDALDLALTLRGHGWNWSRRLYIPRETRPANPMAFVSYAFVSAAAHALICGIFHRAVLSLVPENIPKGSTLFDESLPPLVQYPRASIITTLVAIAAYAGIQTFYDLCTIFGILLLRQDPAQWPPAFDAPWRATSLSDFWGRRWHQFLRHIFLLTGGYPLSLVLGRTGIVIGAFFSSAVFHHINLLTHDNQADFRWMLAGFGMMAPGILVERAFHRLTGREVCGVVGWVWTMGWLIGWSNLMFEGFARAPHDRLTLIDGLPIVRTCVEGLAKGFDEWLHVI